MFCSLDPKQVVLSEMVDCLYKAPLALHARGLDTAVCKTLGLKAEPDLSGWISTVGKIDARRGKVTIALVGKYTDLHDSYLSVVEALHHASYAVGKNVEIKWVNSDAVAEDVDKALEGVDGILVPGGFGTRGVEGMIEAARYARENNVPYLGICLGMQVLVIEFARHVAGIKDATSGEMGEGSKVIDLMPDKRVSGSAARSVSARIRARSKKARSFIRFTDKRKSVNAIATVTSSTTITAKRFKTRGSRFAA